MKSKVKVTILDDLNVWLTTLELQIIAKLLLGMKSEKDIITVKNMISNYRDLSDTSLLAKFAQKFNVEKELKQLI